MLKISGKQRTSTTTFLLAPTEDALLTGPELGGGTLRFVTFTPEETQDLNTAMQAVLKDGIATIKLPLLKQGSFATALELKLGSTGKLAAKIAGQPVGGHLLVHIDIFLDRGPSFAQR